MLQFLAPMLVLLAGVVGVVWIVHVVLKNRRMVQVATLQAETQKRLLERFGSGQELAAYLDSPAGRTFLESATFERRNPYGRILGSVQAGIVLTLVGAGFLYLQGGLPEAEEGLLFLGILGLALGIGFLLSAAAAYFLSKSWGLLDGRTEARAEG